MHPAFLYGNMTPVVTLLHFKLIGDLEVRKLLHPLMFVYDREGSSGIYKTNIFTPTPTQLDGLRRLIRLLESGPDLSKSLRFNRKTLPNESSAHVSTAEGACLQIRSDAS